MKEKRNYNPERCNNCPSLQYNVSNKDSLCGIVFLNGDGVIISLSEAFEEYLDCYLGSDIGERLETVLAKRGLPDLSEKLASYLEMDLNSAAAEESPLVLLSQDNPPENFLKLEIKSMKVGKKHVHACFFRQSRGGAS